MSLSQELIDIIIDEIAPSDKHSLLNLSLSSHACLPRARRHLFRQLCLLPPPPEGTDIDDWTIERRKHIRKFIKLCSHPLSTILYAGPKHVQLTPFIDGVPDGKTAKRRHLSAFIKVLSWLASKSPSPSGKDNNYRKRGAWRNSNATYGERLFCNVQELTISLISPTHGWAELKALFRVSPFPRVTRLILEDMDIRSRQCLSDIVSACPSLEYLSAGVSFDRIPIVKRPVSFPITVTYIKIPVRSTRSKSCLRVFESCATIKDLVFPLSTMGGLPLNGSDINQFLESSAAVTSGTLRHCKLDLRHLYPKGTRYYDLWAKVINFSKVPSWTIVGDVYTFPALASPVENENIIPNVTRFKFHDTAWVLQQPHRKQTVHDLDVMLSSMIRFPNLKEVEVSAGYRFPWEELVISGWDEVALTVREGSKIHGILEEEMNKIRATFPKCWDRGLLRIKCTCNKRSSTEWPCSFVL